MSVRKENRKKSNCSNRGLGLAAAAAAFTIGVGVGAALYYFFSNIEENQSETEGSIQNRQCNETPTVSKEQKDAKRMQTFRERTWSLEECSICFDVILKDQETMSLPCTHHFHSKCIMPWLQQRQTCPNCRKAI